MNYIKHLSGFFEKVSIDYDLNPSHISLYMAIFQMWNQNRFQNPICISRDELMRISKIASYATYHKCIKELNERNYVVYNPSFNPYKGSTLEVINFESYTKPILKKDIKKLKTQLKNSQETEQVVEQPNERVTEQVVEQALNKHCTGAVHVPYKHNKTYTNIINLGKQKKEDDENLKLFQENDEKKCLPHSPTPKIINLKNAGKKKLREKKELKTSVTSNEVEKSRDDMPTSSFQPKARGEGQVPNSDEVKKYFLENSYPPTEAEKFFNYFQSNGWLVGGKAKMKDWKAAARNWMLNAEKFKSKGVRYPEPAEGPKPAHLHISTQKNYDEPL